MQNTIVRGRLWQPTPMMCMVTRESVVVVSKDLLLPIVTRNTECSGMKVTVIGN